jgi:hypothetical protein
MKRQHFNCAFVEIGKQEGHGMDHAKSMTSDATPQQLHNYSATTLAQGRRPFLMRALPSDHAHRFTSISDVDPHKPMDHGGL